MAGFTHRLGEALGNAVDRKLNRDIDKLAKSLNDMIKAFENIGQGRKGARKKADAVADFIGSIRTSVKIKR